MGLRLRAKIKNKIWRPVIRRWGVPGGVVLIGLPLALIIGGGGAYALFLGGSSGQTSASSVNLSKGLVGWWKLNGNAKDSTPYADDGVATGSPTATADQEGTSSSAMSFNNSSTTDYYTVSNSPTLQITGSETISMWINPSNLSVGRQNPICKAYGGEFCISQETNGTVHYYYGRSGINGPSYTNILMSSPLTAGVWTHLVIVRDLSAMTLTWYKDGTQTDQSSAAYSSAVAGTNDMLIGDGYVGKYHGSISDVRIYNRALSSTEVTALYNQYNPSLNTDQGENGLVGWWKLNGNAKDSTPYANNGAIHSSVTPTTDREGQSNGAMSFNGSTSYISMANSSNLEIGTGSHSWSAWFNTSATTRGIIYRMSGSSNANGVLIDISSSVAGQLRCDVGLSPTVIVLSATSTYDDGNWHHLVCDLNRTTNTLNLYVDGQQVGSSNSSALGSSNLVSSAAPTIGQGGGGTFFSGSMSDVRVYNRALSASDVTNLYNSYNSQIEIGGSGASGGVNLSQGLVGYWPFTGNAKDSTPYGDNGTLVNSPALATDREGRANSAYSFNGSNQYINLGTTSTLTPSSISISAWVNANSLGSWNGIISNMTSWGTGFGLQIGTTQKIAATVSGAYLGTSWTPSINTWYDIVATHDSSTNVNVLYVNGAQQATLTHTVTYETNAKTYIGVFYTSPSIYFNGTIDGVRIYNRALTAAEVSALYNED